METESLIEKQLRKLRRRIEEHLRSNTTPQSLIKLADELEINVPKTLRDHYKE